ncbi:MAG: response regulator [Gammaproteobacteria bacterium]|nr:MAG: response regulator [Gammaproteobacteria bacterium]
MTNKQKILVVDDEPTNVTIMHELLEDEYEIKSVSCGQDAMEVMHEFKPDLILLDIAMPEMDGYEVCEWIRTKSELPMVPVIFVSAKDSLEEKLKGYHIGGDDYVTKPFEGVELLAKIKVTFEKAEKIYELEEEYSHARSAALEAMTGVGDSGVIISFLDNCIDCKDFSELGNELLEAAKKFGLHCALQIRSKNKEFNYSNTGESKPLEEELMRKVHTKGRFFDSGARTFVNYERITILVKNMPLEDPASYGRIKDNLPHLLKGADARIAAIENEMSQGRKRLAVKRAIEDTRESLQQAQLLFNNLKEDNNQIMEGLIREMDAELLSLNISNDKEKYLISMLRQNREKMEDSYGAGEQLEQIFKHIIEKMFEIISE